MKKEKTVGRFVKVSKIRCCNVRRRRKKIKQPKAEQKQKNKKTKTHLKNTSKPARKNRRV
ncbi:hypothetical protein [Methanolapillus ohkumae]|uniref:hypothetical protein n=1 Tax=Methanolapillus ohkumae TaxID=3028298 RepID=UPI0030B8938E